MASRDTTSTPYRLSLDRTCYFAYSDGGAPVVTVADYAALRTKGSADIGYGGRITVIDPYIRGAFEWSGTDPYGDGDDGGIALSATDGWWVRRWNYSASSPIHLDWWQPTPSTVYTTLLQMLFDRPLLDMFLKTPSSQSSGYLDKTIWSGNAFTMTGATPFTFYQTSASYPKATSGGAYSTESLVLSGFTVELGSNVEFVGNPEYRNVLVDTPDRWRIQQPIIDLNVTGNSIIRCTVTRPISAGIVVSGGGDAVVSGKYYDADISAGTRGIGHLHFESPEFIDCTGGSMGVNPDDIGGTTLLAYTRYRGFEYRMATRITGAVKVYGGSQLAGATVGGDLGVGSAEEPLDIEYRDAGKMLDYPAQPPIIATYYNDGPGKFDGYSNGANGVYIRFRWVGDYNWLYRDMTLEASPDSVGENKYDQNMYLEFLDQLNPGASVYRERSNGFSIIFDDVDGGGGGIGRVYNNEISGSIASFNISDGPNTFNDVVPIETHYSGPGSYSGAMSVGSNEYLLTDYSIYNPACYVNRMIITEALAQAKPTLTTTPIIQIHEVGEVIFTDLVVEGGAPVHPLIHFYGPPVLAPSITVELINPTLPSGYVVSMAPGYEANASYYTFKVDGVVQTLPWSSP